MSPLLKRRTLSEAGKIKVANVEMTKLAVQELSKLLKHSDTRAIDVLKTVAAHNLFEIPENLRATLHADEAGLENGDEDLEVMTKGAVSGWHEALQAPITQLRLMHEYLSDLAQFDTHQGVKGREFPRVTVVMDDMEARGSLFNFDKFLGATPKSKTDIEHEARGEETTIDRTRRLFYVSCSRAEKSLALIAYSAQPELVRKFLLDNNWLDSNEIEVTV
jgi:DNA helicase-2/ATP-dependent DNA helicase PcrA